MAKTAASQEELIRKYLERMVALQIDLEGPRDELNDVRREARGDGLNLEALNLLVPLISKYPHDKGAKVLNEVMRYAEIIGAENLRPESLAAPRPAGQPVSNDAAPPSENAEHPTAAPSRRKTATSAPLRRTSALLAAICLSIGLVWLLN